ncbi:MAG: type II secretion system F family protein [Spartobacteria bacterium]|nr:type II secretion system F family protein [Spartobacteria bacterium]
MPNFRYTARSKDGQKVAGNIEANDKRNALMQLERNGLVPVSVTEGKAVKAKAAAKGGKDAKGKTKKKKLPMKLTHHSIRKARMKLRDVLLFTGELGDLLSSGMTLGNALNTLSRRKTDKAQDEIVEDLRDEIIQGASLSEALGRWPETFSALFISMVRAGEASGALPHALERLRIHYERVSEAREKVAMALIYPAIILLMGGGTMIFAMVFVVPRFTAIFAELGSKLPLPTRIMIKMSDILGNYGLYMLAALIVGGYFFKRALKTPKGRRWWDALQLKLPIVHSIVSANAFAHFARTLGALLTNGVAVLQALSIVEETAGNQVIAEEIHMARERVTDGSTISGPLAAGRIFPPLLTDMLAVGEQTGDMAGALEHIANRYDKELDRNIKILTTLMEPILMVGMAVMVGFVAISMLLAVFDLTSGLNV